MQSARTRRIALASILALSAVALGALFVLRSPIAQQDSSPEEASRLTAGCLEVGSPTSCIEAALQGSDPADLPSIVSLTAKRVLEVTDTDCHSSLHSLGSATAAEFGVAALVQGGAACAGGYYHGVLNGLGFTDEAIEKCSVLVGEDRSACWHGVGHTTVTSEQFDPSWAAEQCAKSMDESLSEICFQGVAMEFVESLVVSAAPGEVIERTIAMCSAMGLPDSSGCPRQAYNQVATEFPAEVAARCPRLGSGADTCWDALGAALGGAFQPASEVAGLAEELCGGSDPCLDALVAEARASRPASGIADAVCARSEGLASCSGG